MKEFRFKILLKGEKLCLFTGSELIVKTPEGSYKIYRVEGFGDGKPNFYKRPNIVQVLDLDEISCSILCQKVDSEYRIAKFKNSAEGVPEIDESFALIVKSGVGKLEVYDTDSRVTINLQAKEID